MNAEIVARLEGSFKADPTDISDRLNHLAHVIEEQHNLITSLIESKCKSTDQGS